MSETKENKKKESKEEKAMPEKEFRVGNVRTTVWKNKNSDGDSFLTVSLERSYTDSDGNWHKTNSYSVNDLHKAVICLQKAYEFIMIESKQKED